MWGGPTACFDWRLIRATWNLCLKRSSRHQPSPKNYRKGARIGSMPARLSSATPLPTNTCPPYAHPSSHTGKLAPTGHNWESNPPVEIEDPQLLTRPTSSLAAKPNRNLPGQKWDKRASTSRRSAHFKPPSPPDPPPHPNPSTTSRMSSSTANQ